MIEKISLSGKWKFKTDSENIGFNEGFYKIDYDDANWDEIEVPSYWQEKGYDYNGAVWYRTRFMTPKGIKGKIVKVRFNAVDYWGYFWLNGHKIGSHEGYFDCFDFEIGHLLEPDKENILVCQVNAPWEKEDWFAKFSKAIIKNKIYGFKRQLKGVLLDWDCKIHTLCPGGITKDAELVISEGIEFRDITIQTELAEENKAIVSIIANIENRSKEAGIHLKATLKGKNFTSQIYEDEKNVFGPNPTIEIKFTIEKPAFWWTWDQGKPNLYELKLEIFKENTIYDTYLHNVGIRKLEVSLNCSKRQKARNLFSYFQNNSPLPFRLPLKLKKHDQDFWLWKLNGRRIFIRGSNYISNVFVSSVKRESYDKDLEMVKEANLNFLRIHAHLENKDFYDLCDEKGILLEQDFVLQWGYENSKTFDDLAIKMIEKMVNLFKNHPSIAIWCVHNEPMPWNYLRIDKKLVDKVKEIDPTREVIRGSGYPNFDTHLYPGWYVTTVDKIKYAQDVFPTEFGAQAFPNLESVDKFLPEEKRWPLDEEFLKNHDWQPNRMFKYIPQPKSLDNLIKDSQEYQAFYIKTSVEHYRRRKYFSTGAVHFLFVDCNPAITWSVVDFYRIPKPGYFALKESMQPVLPSISWYKRELKKGKKFTADIYIINDLYNEYNEIDFSYLLIGPDGEVKDKISKKINIKPDSSEKIAFIEYFIPLEAPSGKYEVEMKLEKDGEIISENKPWFYVK